MKKSLFKCLVLGCMFLFLLCSGTPALTASVDSAQVPAGWAVWSCWYWPYNDFSINLYDANGAMYRYDRYDTGAKSKNWEYYWHGPPQGQPDWAGHCHAWSGASVWEAQPTASRTLNGIIFRVTDRKGLACESYFDCADGTHNELYVNHPTPGLFWRWLRKEIKNKGSMHGHAMGFVGELYYGGEVWNYPIYKYTVTYSGYPISGTMKVYVAADSSASYANSTTLYYQVFTYQFSGVKVNTAGEPISSGSWIGSGPYSRPDCIWRPYYATTWTTYVVNPHLDASHLGAILN
jgi:hypothetical protein